MNEQFQIVLITAPEIETARRLTHLLLEKKVVACVNLVPQVESHYWWKEKIESSSEVLLICKTAERHFLKLKEVVLEHHPYDCPEIIALPISSGHEPYLQWMRDLIT